MNATHDPALVQAANLWVNQIFWGTLLREARAAHPDPVLGTTPGAAAFQQQLDQVLLERISARTDRVLLPALLKRLDPPAAAPRRLAEASASSAGDRIVQQTRSRWSSLTAGGSTAPPSDSTEGENRL
ncbi:MAG: hypothetical protein JW810_10820 [Sedimentisphaerales bacterium]|nr:hypothetical protein [Sedimentisphaerales bacterium]